ncbi:manganese-binding lipoprotein MntA [Sporosarcina sp. NCCP-2222]|uniref:metal ABC transporter solute-binding protein, Zn/Mn family n=1 Tax=Sporosarcina sp. NCCP-2222 TaxID=2935073 RepID=UPI002083C393|nr:zinc ABC transporter substrate-binding protein [Sporosarcina sp. NCCP-2222]GKV54667.1 manganese-binding lipoprotein MntA [Sporosarcina sp. NCCP-2222]
MKRLIQWISLTLVASILLSACGTEKDNTKDPNAPLKVVTSFTIIADMASEIGGDLVEVHNLVPTGTDPHEYEPLPNDIKAATDADLLFYNGLNLEGGKKGWFFKMIDTVQQNEENVISLTERVEPMYLTNEDGREEEINPHAFIDPAVGIKMAEDLRDALVKKHPAKSEEIQKRGDEYVERLKAIDQEYEERIQDIPEDKRTLVTSERAFQYMTSHYGLREAYIWEIDTEENGSPAQIKSLVNFIREHQVPVLFIESNVDPRPMETVAAETDVRIAEKRIYSDEIGQPGDEVDTYVKYLNYNINLIHDELSK